MLNICGITLIALLLALSVGILGWFLITVKKAFTKFNCLDISVKNKLLLINYYMVFIMEFSQDELIKVGGLSDDEIKELNTIRDTTERLKTAREKINVRPV
jgi:hypothetical protein